MADAFVYDAVRTPRGRGKKDGSLHEVPTPRLAARVLEALRDRNGLDTAKVDDIIMGCVDPVFEAGADIARSAAFWALSSLDEPCGSAAGAASCSGVSTPAVMMNRRA